MEPDEPDDGEYNVLERMMSLGDRVKTLALNEPDAGPWFAMWSPVLAAVLRLGKTLMTLAGRLKAAATSETDIAPIDAQLRDELFEDIKEVGEEFPDVADIFFGLQHLDRVWEAVSSDDDARTAALALLGTMGSVLDRFLSSLVDIAVGDRTATVGPDRVVAFLERYEAIADRLLERWLIPALGVGNNDEGTP